MPKSQMTQEDALQHVRGVLDEYLEQGLNWTQIGAIYKCERTTLRNIYHGKFHIGPKVAAKFKIDVAYPWSSKHGPSTCIMCGAAFMATQSAQNACSTTCATARSAWTTSVRKGRTKAATAQEWYAYRDRLTRNGTCNPRAKISREVAEAVRAAPGKQAAVAAEYGVSRHIVSAIKRGTTWR